MSIIQMQLDIRLLCIFQSVHLQCLNKCGRFLQNSYKLLLQNQSESASSVILFINSGFEMPSPVGASPDLTLSWCMSLCSVTSKILYLGSCLSYCSSVVCAFAYSTTLYFSVGITEVSSQFLFLFDVSSIKKFICYPKLQTNHLQPLLSQCFFSPLIPRPSLSAGQFSSVSI